MNDQTTMFGERCSAVVSPHDFAEKVRAKCEAERGHKLRTYWCAYCNGWHITRREIERPA